MIGALTFGPLGDRFGRKRCLIAAAIIFGIGTLLRARAAFTMSCWWFALSPASDLAERRRALLRSPPNMRRSAAAQ